MPLNTCSRISLARRRRTRFLVLRFERRSERPGMIWVLTSGYDSISAARCSYSLLKLVGLVCLLWATGGDHGATGFSHSSSSRVWSTVKGVSLVKSGVGLSRESHAGVALEIVFQFEGLGDVFFSL